MSDRYDENMKTGRSVLCDTHGDRVEAARTDMGAIAPRARSLLTLRAAMEQES